MTEELVPAVEAGHPLDSLSLEELEETAGELHRRVAVALRRLGERRADQAGDSGRSPRWHACALVAATELAAMTLAAGAAGADIALPRLDRQSSMVAAVMYATPTLGALGGRLEQDRRLLVSLARTLESRLDEERATPWGRTTLRRVLGEVAVLEAARCAMGLEAAAGPLEA